MQHGLVAVMVVELDLQRAVLEEFGRSGAADLVHFVEPGPGEGDVRASVGEVEACMAPKAISPWPSAPMVIMAGSTKSR